MNPGTEDSTWLVINLIVISGHAKKLLQEILKHELGVTATPMDAIHVCACSYNCKQETIQGSLFLSEGSATLCLPQDDSTHEDNYCKAADTFKSSHSLFHGNWFVHPLL